MAERIIEELSMAPEMDNENDFLAIRQPLTYMSLIIYSALFIYIYAQLWLVMKYGHKRWCYRTYVLYISIVWCILRITLFSYYCMLEHQAAYGQAYTEGPRQLSQRLCFVSYFILYSLPLYLQFSCLGLMVAYFYQIFRSSHNDFIPAAISDWRWPSYVLVFLNVTVLVVNLCSAALIKWEGNHTPVPMASSTMPSSFPLPLVTVTVVHIRVLLNGATFMALAAALAYLTLHVANTPATNQLLEMEHLTPCSSVLVCVLLVFLFLCRTVINVLALIPAVNFVLDTDQVDLLSDSHGAYLMFVTVLFLWEFMPTLLMVLFFRVKPDRTNLTNPLVEPLLPERDDTDYANQLVDTISDGSSEEGYNNQYRYNSSHRYHSSSSNIHQNAAGFSFLHAGSYQPSPSPVRASPFSSSTGLPTTGTGGVSHSPNHQYYGYEVAESPQHASAVCISRSLTSPPYGLYSADAAVGRGRDGRRAQQNLLVGAEGSIDHTTAGVVGDEEGNVHSLSTRFHHRTSLFGYRILNRASRPV